MIVLRRTRLILGALADVRWHRDRLAKSWRRVRNPRALAHLKAPQLRGAMRRLEVAMRRLEDAWECCVLRNTKVPVV